MIILDYALNSILFKWRNNSYKSEENWSHIWYTHLKSLKILQDWIGGNSKIWFILECSSNIDDEYILFLFINLVKMILKYLVKIEQT